MLFKENRRWIYTTEEDQIPKLPNQINQINDEIKVTRYLFMMKIKIEPMEISDAKSVAEIHTKSWQFAYKGIIPQAFLDAIDIKKRAENWAKGMTEDPHLVRLVAYLKYFAIQSSGLHGHSLLE